MGEPAQSPESTPLKPSRDELNERAAELGIASPEGLKNMEAVEEAISDAEALPRFSRAEVLDLARSLTGFSRNHMAGALHGNEQKTFTKEEATKIGERFARHEAVA
jgi:hypothetical protein